MSQDKVLMILAELPDGRAKASAISDKCKERYPDATLWQYAASRLTKMREWGDVGYDAKTHEWYLTAQGWEAVKVLQAQAQKVRKK